MGLKASFNSQQSNFKKPDALEPGTYPARIVRVLDMGMQPQRPYKGEEKAPAHEITVTYELSDEFMKDEEGNDLEDKPRWVSETFALNSMKADLAKSTKRMKTVDPENKLDGDWSQTLGLPVLITIVVNTAANGNKYENVANTAAVRAKDVVRMPELKNPALFLDLQEPDLDVFNKLPKWQQEKITSNLEYAGSPLEKLLKGGKGDAAEAPQKPAKQAKKAPAEDEEEASKDVPW